MRFDVFSEQQIIVTARISLTPCHAYLSIYAFITEMLNTQMRVA